MRNWIALLLALMMVSLCGCGALNDVEGTTAPPRETAAPVETTVGEMEIVELSVWVVSEAMWADTAAVDALLAEFGTYYPNISVTVERKTAADLGSGKPDIVLAEAGQIAAWNESGNMADLAELWTAGLHSDVYDAAVDACRSETGYHTVPMSIVPYCMAVRKSAFEDAGALEYLNTTYHTWNTATFLTAAQTVSDEFIGTVASVFCKDTEEDVYTRLLVTNLYDGSFADHKTGYYTVNSEKMVKAMNALRNISGISFDGAVDAETAREQFLAGETAMTFSWNTQLQMQHAADSDILFMAYPASNGRPDLYGEVYGFGIFDNGDSVKVAASKTFVAYMSGNAAAIRATANLPARASFAGVYDGTPLERTASELTRLVDYMTTEYIAPQHWDTARDQWRELLRSLNGEEETEVYTQVCQDALDALFPELAAAETTVSDENY